MPGRPGETNASFVTDLYPIRICAGDVLTASNAEALFHARPQECVNRNANGLDPNTVSWFRPEVVDAVNSQLRVTITGLLAGDGTVGPAPTGAKVRLYAFYSRKDPRLTGKAVYIDEKTAVGDGIGQVLFERIPAGCHLVILCDKASTLFFSHTL
jgi:hypothetical protein